MARGKLCIASINTRRLNNTKTCLSLINWIRDNHIDVTIVQETFCTEYFIPKFNFHWKGVIYHSCTDSKQEVFALY